ncbi:MAG: ferrous iron transport protein A [Ignavibacteriales bacterium]|nr:ferrous iron transport protein A [Ignavibacteriales bacterium]
MPLHQVPKGSRVVIIDIPDGKSKDQLIRLGILKGEFVKCLERLPGGTMVIEKNRQEIAIGVTLARTILVAYANTETLTQESNNA